MAKTKAEKVLAKLNTAAGHVFVVGDATKLDEFFATVPPDERGKLAIETLGRGKTGVKPFVHGELTGAVCSFFPASEIMLIQGENGLHLVPAQVDSWRVSVAMPTLLDIIHAEVPEKPTAVATIPTPTGIIGVARMFPAWKTPPPPLTDEERQKLGRGGLVGWRLLLVEAPGTFTLSYERMNRSEEWGTISGRVAFRPA
jgi:hypothetical protein